MTSDSIVITGLGFLTAAGDTPEAILNQIKTRHSTLTPLTGADFSTMAVTHGGQINPQLLEKYGLDPFKLKGFKPYISHGLVSVGNALRDSGLLDTNKQSNFYDKNRFGVFVSSGINGENAEGLFEGFQESLTDSKELDLKKFATQGIDMVHPKWILTALSNNLIFFITSEFQLKGDNNNVTYSGLGGYNMLDAAVSSLRCGASDAAIVNGTDSLTNWQTIDDLTKLGILGNPEKKQVTTMPAYTETVCGGLPAEVSATLILETRTKAEKRGAQIYGEILHLSQYHEGHDFAFPSSEGYGTTVVLDELLASLPASSHSVLLNLKGSAIPAWDQSELSGIKKSLQKNPSLATKLRLTSATPYFGVSWSASYVLDVALTLLARHHQVDFQLPHQITNPEWSEFFHGSFPTDWDHTIVLGQCLGGNTGGVLLGNL